MYNIAIVEDEQDAAETLLAYLKRYEKENNVTFQTTTFQNGITFLSGYRNAYDLIFMDIEMPHMDGMTAAEKLREIDDVVSLMFVTNMSQYAVNGYEVDACDFLVKPVSYEVFAYKLRKTLAKIDRQPREELILQKKQNVIRLRISQILYVEVNSHQILYHMENDVIEDWGTLVKIEKQLKPYHFSRCNSCYLVNLAHVDHMDQEYVYVGNDRLLLSRGKKQSFRQDMLDYLEVNAR